ncbi:hypothetical protein [Bacillus sp. JCM 19041]|uniref:hypothetical protein n=1 Tax=Bacillus sp. JCM 19041 TaxID=1460637 RepID=UPI0006CF6C97
MQIGKGDEYKSELDYVTTQKVHIDAPRGLMYDARDRVVVDNSLELSVTYTNPGDHTEKEQLELARKLANIIHFELEMPSFRDKQEYYYANLELNERKALLDGGVFEQDDSRSEYERIIEQITEQMVEDYSAEEDAIYIFSQMARGSKGVPHRIKQSITDREANQLAERLDKLPSIDMQRDSKRTYVYGDTLRSLFGRVGPIQSEETEVYLTKGYERSDLVGTSYLELAYENVLKGQKGERTLTRQSNGNEQQKTTVSEEVGSRGNDLVLTIDMAYQQLLDQSVKKHVEENRGRFVEDASAYAVVINENRGHFSVEWLCRP